MDKKLTISLNIEVIERAKKYAKDNNISLSRLVENYLQALAVNKTKEIEITPLVESLSGVIDLSSTINARDEYTNYLNEKYK